MHDSIDEEKDITNQLSKAFINMADQLKFIGCEFDRFDNRFKNKFIQENFDNE